jgi:2-amino-4-hydroxy-6-hydroxymethyldihydropteridine diphosphokinase
MLTEGVFIALGSNVGDREQYISKAIGLLGVESKISMINQSTCIETDPVGPIAQGLFLNCVIEISTSLSPKSLLAVCLAIEEKLGRIRTERWGPRTIDLDIVMFGSLVIDDSQLTIPHPELLNRTFVLIPLAEISPQVCHPLLGITVLEMLQTQT